MKKRVIIFFMFLFPVHIHAQFSDDFSDGDFSRNPPWHGDDGKFVVDAEMLRLSDQAAGQAFLATANSLIDNAQWEFWLRLAFTPSNNNHPRIYLISDSPNLHDALNGYYLRIGKNGGDNKRLYFYRQDGLVCTEIMSGSMNIADGSNNLIRIRVTRDSDGKWDVYADPAGGHLFMPQGSVVDANHSYSEWFGVRCQYTVSNAQGFYYDGISVKEMLADTVPPSVNDIQVVSANTLKVFFDKVVEAESAETIHNYSVDQGLGSPMIASLDPLSPNTVSLLFSENFAENKVYSLQVRHVQDHAGNTMPDFSGTFVDYHPQAFDVVFNELMANPNPAVALPPYEFIELYNTTDLPVGIEGWTLQYGSTKRTIPPARIPAKGFLLLVAEAAYARFQAYGNVVAVSGLAATALTNAGTDLMLFDHQDQLISFVSYSDRWYQDPAKCHGGWSLEKIDPYNVCQGRDNWRASVDTRGGSPLASNSVLASNPDVTPPDLIRAGYVDNHSVLLFFSEPMDVSTLEDEGNYHIDPGRGQPSSATALFPDFSRVSLSFEQPMHDDTIYEISPGEGLTDCAGNQIRTSTAKVAVPQTAEATDVVINEVLFNPVDQGSRYIELYNRSQKVFDLKDHLLTSKDTVGHFFTSVQEISRQSFLLFPEEYVVLTSEPESVKKSFMTSNPEAFIRVDRLPGMTNAHGILVFATKGLKKIDMFVYEEDMHFPLLTTCKGVALERLNPAWPTQDRSNWHSAAHHVGFGTPGYKNSQFTSYPDSDKGQVDLFPEVFSPDGDGQDDLLNISYSFDQPGFVANIRIFDSRGRLITYLSRAELLATSGVITWDGTCDDRQKAPIGIYIVHIEVFDLEGQVRNYRKTTVLGGQL